jgi:type I pantothenate kinase
MSDLEAVADALLSLRGGRDVFVVGLTGGVAAGKSTLAAALAERLRARGLAVDTVSTDGFLRSNADLDAAGLSTRKGFPESYDVAAMAAALRAVRSGRAAFPVYSHVTYDIDPAVRREIGPVELLIVEGLGLGPAAPVDALVYLDADEADLEAWYRGRFMGLWEAGRDDPASFYHRFRSLDADGAQALARLVWTQVNLRNLRENILPLRPASDLVVRKRADHAIEALWFPGRGAGSEEPSPA